MYPLLEHASQIRREETVHRTNLQRLCDVTSDAAKGSRRPGEGQTCGGDAVAKYVLDSDSSLAHHRRIMVGPKLALLASP